nr:MAG TPA: hypothetical protein [Caudoviricetes sp.]
MLLPFTDIRKSAPLNAGTIYRSHSYSRTEFSPVSAPAIALNGMSGIPSWLLVACWAMGMLLSLIIEPLPVKSHSADN